MRPSTLLPVITILLVSLLTVEFAAPIADAATQSSASSISTKYTRWRELRRQKRQEWQQRANGNRSSISSAGPVKRTGQFGYEPYTPSKVGEGQESLLFFFGLWSIPSRANDATLKQWAGSGGFLVPVLKVDYDKETALKKKYGVRYVNTFVLVDGKGTKVKLLESPYSPALSFILYGR